MIGDYWWWEPGRSFLYLGKHRGLTELSLRIEEGKLISTTLVQCNLDREDIEFISRSMRYSKLEVVPI